MGYRIGKYISYFASALFIVMAIMGGLRDSPILTLVVLVILAILSYEFADYLDYVRYRSSWNAREREPCLHCRSRGKIGKRTCPKCGGKGYMPAPVDKFRPPIT